MRPAQFLMKSELFATPGYSLDISSRVELSYRRARAIAHAYGMTREDIIHMTPKFWQMHSDPIMCVDGAASTLLTIQYNLAIGTIATFASGRRDLCPLLDKMLNYEVIGQFCLTEVGHGLDASNLETTATLTPDGDFELHSPTENAAKYMPPTIPVLGIPCVAVVFARLVMNGQEKGVQPFMVTLNDGKTMCRGVTAKLLPPRGGSQPVNHAITSFNRVKIPGSALLGDIAALQSSRVAFLASISRVAVGTLALASMAIPSLEIATYIAANYSFRRNIGGPEGNPIPIFSFPTQHTPIFVALAQAYVLKAFNADAIKLFADITLDFRVRHGIATCLKAIMVQHSQASHLALSDRCGAQGLFSYNQITSQHTEMRGVAIAEGDILVLSIRLISEILLGRYRLPTARNPDSLLSKHEADILAECRGIVATYGHRSPEFSRFVLPRCQSMVEAIGHRMAYESALGHGVPRALIEIYRCSVIKIDEAWYVEKGFLERRALSEAQDAAITEALPHLQDWIREMKVEPYITAPIVSDSSWSSFVQSLKVFEGCAPGI